MTGARRRAWGWWVWAVACIVTLRPLAAQQAGDLLERAPQAGSIAAAPRPTSPGFVWTVARDGRVGWLMGSIHMLTPDAYPLPAPMEAAFQASQVVLEEADPEELKAPAAAAELVRRAFFPPGQTLEGSLSPPTYRLLVDRAAKAGLPASLVQQMRPWMIAVTVSALEIQRGGYDPALGLDKHFRDRAVGAGKQVQTLETAMEQIAILESLGPALQEALVLETLDGTSTEIAQTRALTAAWKAGDAAGIEKLLVEDMKDSPEIHRALLVDRNSRWMPRIESCLAASKCLVVVGAAHLVGKDGLIERLRGLGYRVEQR